MSTLPTKEQRYQYFALDFGDLVKERSRGGVLKIPREQTKESYQYESGRLLTFYEILTLMIELAKIYKIPINSLKLHDIDPAKELFDVSRKLALRGDIEQLWNQESQVTKEWIKALGGYGVSKLQKGKIYMLYLQELGSLFRERAFELKAKNRRVYQIDTVIYGFVSGQLSSYGEVVSIMQEAAKLSFQIPLKEISLLGIVPERDL